MSDPATMEEYTALYMQNSRVDGYGAETAQIAACPFCAAPDWARLSIIAVKEDMAKEHTCSNCGRSAKFLFHVDEPSNQQFELVQTGGDPIADYLPPVRRIDN